MRSAAIPRRFLRSIRGKAAPTAGTWLRFAQRAETPIVPKGSLTGHALLAVIAIMGFLAAITTGALVLVLQSAADWQSDLALEMTIQVRPAAGRDTEAEVARAVAIARATPGVAEVRPYSREESARLLEPWLGSGLSLDGLPVPRLIVLRLARDARPDLPALRAALSSQVAGATLDDHRGWIDRMRAMTRVAVVASLTVLGLMLAATVMSVAFATRGAMEANRPIVEVLSLIGATERYIARQFQRHFLVLGLQGGLVGGVGAVVAFALLRWLSGRLAGDSAGEQASALFGNFSIGWLGYLALLAQVALIAAIAAMTSRQIVYQTLRSVGEA